VTVLERSCVTSTLDIVENGWIGVIGILSIEGRGRGRKNILESA
jgi:hypothetical protein